MCWQSVEVEGKSCCWSVSAHRLFEFDLYPQSCTIPLTRVLKTKHTHRSTHQNQLCSSAEQSSPEAAAGRSRNTTTKLTVSLQALTPPNILTLYMLKLNLRIWGCHQSSKCVRGPCRKMHPSSSLQQSPLSFSMSRFIENIPFFPQGRGHTVKCVSTDTASSSLGPTTATLARIQEGHLRREICHPELWR